MCFVLPYQYSTESLCDKDHQVAKSARLAVLLAEMGGWRALAQYIDNQGRLKPSQYVYTTLKAYFLIRFSPATIQLCLYILRTSSRYENEMTQFQLQRCQITV